MREIIFRYWFEVCVGGVGSTVDLEGRCLWGGDIVVNFEYTDGFSYFHDLCSEALLSLFALFDHVRWNISKLDTSSGLIKAFYLDKKSPNRKRFCFFVFFFWPKDRKWGSLAIQKTLESNYSALAKHDRIDCGHFPGHASKGRVRNLDLNPCENM